MRRGKYNAVKVRIDGFVFDSKKEAKRYAELKLIMKKNLIIHPRYPCDVNGIHICTYVGDFEYLTPDGKVVLEDVKGVRTPLYRLKRKLVEALYDIKITEV